MLDLNPHLTTDQKVKIFGKSEEMLAKPEAETLQRRWSMSATQLNVTEAQIQKHPFVPSRWEVFHYVAFAVVGTLLPSSPGAATHCLLSLVQPHASLQFLFLLPVGKLSSVRSFVNRQKFNRWENHRLWSQGESCCSVSLNRSVAVFIFTRQEMVKTPTLR